MRLVCVALVIFLAPIFSCTTAWAQDKSNVTTVDVCIYNDACAPVSVVMIDALMADVAKIYLEKAGIRLRVVARAMYDGGMDGGPDAFVHAMNRAYSKKQTLKILFTEHPFLLVSDNEGRLYWWRGVTLPAEKMSIIFAISFSFTDVTKSGENQALATLRHEIGHLFGLLDSTDSKSFMYAPTADSAGQFTKVDLEGLKKYRESRK